MRDADSGRVCCHLCGRWFVALGSHVRAHGLTAQSYRAALGLVSRRALASRELSEGVQQRQRAAYAQDAAMRERLAVGQDLARSGQLAWRRRRAATSTEKDEPVQLVRERTEQLAAGRATQRAGLDRALAARLARLGAADLAGVLRERYAEGASLAELRQLTGLGQARLQRELAAAGVTVRPSGVNLPGGKQARARAAERQAAERLGVADLSGWLLERRRAGASLKQLAREVGHSSHWVRWRLEALARQEQITDPAVAAAAGSR